MNEYYLAMYYIINLLSERGFSVAESERLLMHAIREMKEGTVTSPPQHLKERF